MASSVRVVLLLSFFLLLSPHVYPIPQRNGAFILADGSLYGLRTSQSARSSPASISQRGPGAVQARSRGAPSNYGLPTRHSGRKRAERPPKGQTLKDQANVPTASSPVVAPEPCVPGKYVGVKTSLNPSDMIVGPDTTDVPVNQRTNGRIVTSKDTGATLAKIVKDVGDPTLATPAFRCGPVEQYSRSGPEQWTRAGTDSWLDSWFQQHTREIAQAGFVSSFGREFLGEPDWSCPMGSTRHCDFVTCGQVALNSAGCDLEPAVYVLRAVRALHAHFYAFRTATQSAAIGAAFTKDWFAQTFYRDAAKVDFLYFKQASNLINLSIGVALILAGSSGHVSFVWLLLPHVIENVNTGILGGFEDPYVSSLSPLRRA